MTDTMTNVYDFGATGDWTTDDLPAVMNAAAAAAATTGILFCPPGGFTLYPTGMQSYSWLLAQSNLTIVGVPGESWFVHPPAMPNRSIALVQASDVEHVTFKGMGFDGRWGNRLTTIDSSSDRFLQTGLTPYTLNVLSTEGFPSSGTCTVIGSAGPEVVTYTGTTDTSFTGCTGGTGMVFTTSRVGYVNGTQGINHVTQTDPRNYLLMARGVDDLLVEDCRFRQAYGDFVWMGGSANANKRPASNVKIIRSHGDMSARNGFTIGGYVDGVTIRDCNLTSIHAQALDSEPVWSPVRNVKVSGNLLDIWWDAEATSNAPLSIVGGSANTSGPQTQTARNWTVVDNTINGAVLIEKANDVLLENNRIIQDYAKSTWSPIVVQLGCEDVLIGKNYIYTRSAIGLVNGISAAAIVLYDYISGAAEYQPNGVKVWKNRIYARNGRYGIMVFPSGGSIYDSTGALERDHGTSTTVTDTTMVDSGKAWRVNQWVGFYVRIGTALAGILSNTATTLTLASVRFSVPYGWATPLGAFAPTPGNGPYTIMRNASMIDIDENEIDCGDDGYGKGKYGIHVNTGGSGHNPSAMRLSVVRNRIKNADVDAIHCDFNPTVPFAYLEIDKNFAMDDQCVPTTVNVVGFTGTPKAKTFILGDNTKGEGVTNLVSGLTSGTWLIRDGFFQEWGGFGSPEGVVSAPPGSVYRRRDGTPGTYSYVKEAAASGNTGWVAK